MSTHSGNTPPPPPPATKRRPPHHNQTKPNRSRLSRKHTMPQPCRRYKGIAARRWRKNHKYALSPLLSDIQIHVFHRSHDRMRRSNRTPPPPSICEKKADRSIKTGFSKNATYKSSFPTINIERGKTKAKNNGPLEKDDHTHITQQAIN